MTERLCPIDGNPLPERVGRGRPREFCSKICGERARQRRKRAAKLLEFALRLDDLAEEIRAGTAIGYGTAESQEMRAHGLRELAAEELRGLPL